MARARTARRSDRSSDFHSFRIDFLQNEIGRASKKMRPVHPHGTDGSLTHASSGRRQEPRASTRSTRRITYEKRPLPRLSKSEMIPRWIVGQTDLRSWSLRGETVANIGHIHDRTKDIWLNIQLKPSVALMSAAASPGSVPVCPASSIMSRCAVGQTLCSAHALFNGVTTS